MGTFQLLWQALLVLYVANALLMNDKYAQDGVYGSYTGLIWLTPILGGYIADRLWGNRRSIIVGGFLMAIGQFLMFISRFQLRQSRSGPCHHVGGTWRV